MQKFIIHTLSPISYYGAGKKGGWIYKSRDALQPRLDLGQNRFEKGQFSTATILYMDDDLTKLRF